MGCWAGTIRRERSDWPREKAEAKARKEGRKGVKGSARLLARLREEREGGKGLTIQDCFSGSTCRDDQRRVVS
jgi:hypothetical protein